MKYKTTRKAIARVLFEKWRLFIMIVTGCKTRQGYKMHAPTFPYLTTHYIGYSLEGMKKKYRQDHGLKYKRIEWVIL